MIELILDSGAFTAFNKKETIRIGDYEEYLQENKCWLKNYFNLDVLSDGEKSFINWIHLKANGLKPIPVFHIGTDEKYLKEYLKTEDYIAIGAIADMSTSKRLVSLERIWEDYLTDKKGFPKVKVHGFGLTSIRVMKRYPWYSVDSTSWVMFGRYGAILVPKTNKEKPVYDENPFIVSVSDRSPKRKNIGEHFQNFPENVKLKIEKYVNELGFSMEELSMVHHKRDLINMLYYIGVQNSIPEWPWQWKASLTNNTLF